MKYPHIVVKNGIWYPSGTDVPEDISIIENKIVDQPVSYSKTEINRMPIADLRALAEKENISGFEEKTGAELKKLLIKKYGL